MSSGYAKWGDVKAKGRASDPRTGEEQAAGKAAARERGEAYVRGHSYFFAPVMPRSAARRSASTCPRRASSLSNWVVSACRNSRLLASASRRLRVNQA